MDFIGLAEYDSTVFKVTTSFSSFGSKNNKIFLSAVYM
jgi:hypothetical protein